MLHGQKEKSVLRRVGLDIGTHSIKAVEVVQRGSEMVVCSAGSAAMPRPKARDEMPSSGAIVQAIRNLWSSAGFRSKKVVMALPPDALYVKWLYLEASDEEALRQTANQAATRGAPFPTHDAIVDYRALSSRGGLPQNVHFVMLLTASGAAVDSLLDIAESAGLEPLAVDMGAAAALGSLKLQRAALGRLWSGQPVAHCDIGARLTTISVVRGGELEFARSVPIGGDDFADRIAEAANVRWAEAERIKTAPGTRVTGDGVLTAAYDGHEIQVPCDGVIGRMAREIQRSLGFFRTQFAEGSYLGTIGAVTLSGGGTMIKGLDACLGVQGVDVAGTVNPFAGLSVDAEGSGIRGVGDTSPSYATAVGLAIEDYWNASEGEEFRAAA